MYCRLKPYASRYETTVGLPIEYGALNVGNVASGMLFYGEVRHPPPHQPATLLERGHKCSVMDGCALSARPTHDMMEGSQLAITPRAGALHVGRPAVACDRWRRPTARRHRCRSVAASAAHAAHAAHGAPPPAAAAGGKQRHHLFDCFLRRYSSGSNDQL